MFGNLDKLRALVGLANLVDMHQVLELNGWALNN
jgi:hypothetical protein